MSPSSFFSSCKHLDASVKQFNELASPDDALVLDHFEVVQYQNSLSGKTENHHLGELFDKASLPDKARLLSVSLPYAAAWLSDIPSIGLNLHLDPAEFQTAVWWLGIAIPLPFLSIPFFGPFRSPHLNMGGNAVSCHNRLRDVLLESCRRACQGPHVEAGSGLGHEGHRTQPADVLIPHWDLGNQQLTITSTLNSSTLLEANVTGGSAVMTAKVCKHNSNDAKCLKLGWLLIPISVCWGAETMQSYLA